MTANVTSTQFLLWHARFGAFIPFFVPVDFGKKILSVKYPFAALGRRLPF